MKKLLLAFLLYSAFNFHVYSQIGIGNPTPDPSAILDLTATDKGLLIPRLTEIQKNSISNPATGLIIFQSDGQIGLYFYDGSVWKAVPIEDTNTTYTAGTGLSLTGSEFQLALTPSILSSALGTTTIDASALLQLESTSKGFLLPSMTEAQRDAISTPAQGLLIYQLDQTAGLYQYDGSNWSQVGAGDNLGNHLLTQALDLNGKAITDNTDGSTQLTIQSLVDTKDVHIKSYDEIYLTTIDGRVNSEIDPNGNPYTTAGDIELLSADDILIKTIGDDVIIEADDDIKLDAGFDGSGAIVVYDPIESPGGDNIILDSGNDIELKVTSGDFVEIWEDGVFLYTLPGSRGTVGQFLQRSSDGSSEFFSNWSSYKLPTADGTTGQILTTDGSGTVSWADASGGGANALNDLSDAITYGTSNLTIGHTTTGSITTAAYNVGIGLGTNQAITSGLNNIALGLDALYTNSIGSNNVAIGRWALKSNTAGDNTAIGYNTLWKNTSGSNLTAIGSGALDVNTTGNYSTAVGVDVMGSNTTGRENTGVGYYALGRNTSGNFNAGFGVYALDDLTTGGNNTGLGYKAGQTLSTGFSNIYIGFDSKASSSDVNREIVIGAEAVGNGTNTITLGHTTNTAVHLRGDVILEETHKLWIGGDSNASGSYHLPVADGTTGQILTTDGSGTVSWSDASGGGASSLNELSDAITYGTQSLTIGHSTTGTINSANNNTAVGILAFQSVTSGDDNTAIGRAALYTNSTGSNNTAVGASALYNFNGNSNSAFGRRALFSNTTGAFNTALGESSLTSLTLGKSNTAIGKNAGFSLNSSTAGDASFNVFVGTDAGYNAAANTNKNVFIGTGSGKFITSVSNSVFLGEFAGSPQDPVNPTVVPASLALGENNIYIGANSDASAANVTGEIVIGPLATGNGSNTITLGHTTNTDVYARGNVHATSYLSTSDRRLKTDIRSLSQGVNTVMQLNPVTYRKRLNFDSEDYTRNEIGFIAQDVKEILPELVSEGPDKNKILSLDYNSLIPILTKAIQEQQAQIELLKKEIEALKKK